MIEVSDNVSDLRLRDEELLHFKIITRNIPYYKKKTSIHLFDNIFI